MNKNYNFRIVGLAILLGVGAASSVLLATDPPKTGPATTTSAPAPAAHKAPINVNEEYALKFYQENLQEIYATISIVKQKDPGAYNRNFKDKMISETRRLVDYRERGSRMYEPAVLEARLSFRSSELSKQLRSPELLTSEEVKLKKEELGKVLGDLFDVRTAIRDIELDSMRESIDKLIRDNERMRKELADRKGNKEALVEQQLKDLIQPKINK